MTLRIFLIESHPLFLKKESTLQNTRNAHALRHIIIQAGGKGTRLEGLTRNKPKCLVPYDNLPIIFHLFRKFEGARFTIIADYKIEVLQKYLNVFAKGVDYRILKAQNEGTISGISEAIRDFNENEPFMIIWCDLILSKEFKLPNMRESCEKTLDSTNESIIKAVPPPHLRAKFHANRIVA